MHEHLKVFEEIRAIASTGLNHARNPYDKAHYERLLEIAAGEYSKYLDIEPLAVLSLFKKELGYITCKVGVNAAIFDDHGKILLEQRADDQCWGLPGGWVDVNEKPETAVVREIKEEASLNISVG